MRTLIIPVFNEQSTIFKLVDTIKKSNIFNEIIVVDDGSTDNTNKALLESGTIYIQHKKNLGKGAALKTGLKAASGNTIMFLDGDIEAIDTAKINKMIELIENDDADVVIGTFRFGCFQTFTEVVFKPLTRLFFPEVMKTIKKGFLSGQRAFKKDVLDKIHLQDDFGVEAAMDIELTFMTPKPRIRHQCLGRTIFRIKGFQTSMNSIADTIIAYAKMHGRIDRVDSAFFKKVVQMLNKKIELL
ncbi:MAG TPA: glycosyltransferase family 2 protein [Candidatus Nanoarchaeia archaeon]|nr:glycosyltransferase family 2 protein [Candidatus Nanoarchaeia archaeon]